MSKTLSYVEAINGPDSQKWIESMTREFTAHQTNKTWRLVPWPNFIPSNRTFWSGTNPSNGKKGYLISGVWNYQAKTGKGGIVTNLKSRWCGNGSRMVVENEHTFVSIARPATIRIVASLAAATNCTLSSGDVPSAYVKSVLPSDIEVYVLQPDGFQNKDNPTHLCLLSKALYGLPFAGKC